MTKCPLCQKYSKVDQVGICEECLKHEVARDRNRREFLRESLSLGLAASLPFDLAGRSRDESGFPFSPSRIVYLPHRLGRRHWQARRVIERKVDELAGMDLHRLPAPKVEALLEVAVVVADYYGIGDRLDAWAERIPVQESFTSQTCGNMGLLTHWQPRDPVARVRSPVDWWLFLSPKPIEWGSLDDVPIHALIAHVSRTDYWSRLTAMLGYWSDASYLARICDESDFWPRLARLNPVEVVKIINGRYVRAKELQQRERLEFSLRKTPRRARPDHEPTRPAAGLPEPRESE
jgi:hypothetical protein